MRGATGTHGRKTSRTERGRTNSITMGYSKPADGKATIKP